MAGERSGRSPRRGTDAGFQGELAASCGIGRHDPRPHRTTRGVAGGRFDVAIVSIGVNDVITGRRTRQWTAALASLLDLLESGFGVRHILLSALPPMHRFTALPQPLRWCVGLRARRFNDELLRFASRDGRCAVVSLDYPRDPSYLAPDGFHPGEPAYRHWAAAVAARVRQLPSGAASEDLPA
ncbi:MAG: SGNH/GDSL hydrolase family protein [Dechloromonas sp.]|uniref:SGNH/GDSL hydrolase family protein n=1 Tax=Candidatus Dechloromonas phosphorivorans TaxID=2899244 RepID=A0A9D7LSU4_9RHOO|nr:SGNH/GDSL hydrolase family protein [Candidatus Dechloromonas phosphorivorans]